MIRLPESPAAVQAVAWVGHLDDGSRLLVRLYTDGSVTAERRVVGAYMGELALTPEPVSA
jgi:hypothetical protein